jgi:hypothetical protein
MANSYITNLYPRPTENTRLRKLAVPTNANKQLEADGTQVTPNAGAAGNFNSLTRYVVLDVQDNDAYVSYDGVDAAAGAGHRLYAGRSYTWSKKAAQSAKFLAISGTANIYASEFTD